MARDFEFYIVDHKDILPIVVSVCASSLDGYPANADKLPLLKIINLDPMLNACEIPRHFQSISASIMWVFENEIVRQCRVARA